MLSYVLSLLWQAALLTFTHMGTTVLAVGSGLFRSSIKTWHRVMSTQDGQPWWKKDFRPEWKELKVGATLALVLWCLLFIYCLFEASFTNSKTAEADKRRCAQEKSELQKKLDAFTVPKLAGRYTVFLGPWKGNTNTLVTVDGTIRNQGAPTTLEGFELTLRFRDGRVVNSVILLPPPPSATHTIHQINGASPAVVLDGSDWWPHVARSSPVVTNGAAPGWYWAVFEGVNDEDVAKHATLIRHLEMLLGRSGL